jgi:hypothetical protein
LGFIHTLRIEILKWLDLLQNCRKPSFGLATKAKGITRVRA